MSRPLATADPAAGTAWLVVLLADGSSPARIVADPTGLTPVGDIITPRVMRAAAGLAGGAPMSWAWGQLPADAPTPQVWFHRRWSVRGRRAQVRRLSATVWAAQASGRWPRVWLS